MSVCREVSCAEVFMPGVNLILYATAKSEVLN